MIVIIKIILYISYLILNITYWNRNKPKVKRIFKNIKYGNKRVNKLDIIIPEKNGKLPIIVYLHGGGFISSDKSFFTRICCELANNDFVVFNINYGLVPKNKYPSQLQDINDAINWIIKNHQNYNCDITKIFLVGDSAGAYISSLYVCAKNNNEIVQKSNIKNFNPLKDIKGLILFYGAYDIKTVLEGNFPLKDIIIPKMFNEYLKVDNNGFNNISPAKNITNNFPPTFLCVSENDPLYMETIRFKKILDDIKINNKAVIFLKNDYPCIDHGFLNFYKKEPSKIAMKECVEFMEKLV